MKRFFSSEIRSLGPFVNVSLLGAHECGKSSLYSQLSGESNVSSNSATFSQIKTRNFWGSLTDLPGNPSYYKNKISYFHDTDIALFLISNHQGVLPESYKTYQIVKHLMKSSASLIPIIYQFESHESDLTSLIKEELAEFVTGKELERTLEINRELTPFSFFSTLKDFLSLNDKQDKMIEGPLLWPLQNIGSIPSKGTFVAGKVARGKVKASRSKETFLFYQGRKSKVYFRNCEIFREPVNEIYCGERGGAFVNIQVPSVNPKRGAVIYESSSDLVIGHEWDVELNDENEEVFPFGDLVFFHQTHFEGKAELMDKNKVRGLNKLRLRMPILARVHDSFVLQSNARQSSILGRLLQVVPYT